MLRYLNADFWRLLRRLPRWTIWIVYLTICALYAVSARNTKGFNFVQLGDTITTILAVFPILMAMFNLYFVYEDDLQAKTMQIAIGRGISKLSVVFVKWLEMVILSIVDCISLIIVMSLVGMTKNAILKDHAASLVIAQAVSTVMLVAVITSIIMMLVFYSMHVGLLQVLFLFLCLEPVTRLLSFAERTNEIMTKLQLSRFLPGGNLEGLRQSLTTGQFNIQNILVIVIYLVVGMAVSRLILSKKELDF